MVRIRAVMLTQGRLLMRPGELSGTEVEEEGHLVDCRNCSLCSAD